MASIGENKHFADPHFFLITGFWSTWTTTSSNTTPMRTPSRSAWRSRAACTNSPSLRSNRQEEVTEEPSGVVVYTSSYAGENGLNLKCKWCFVLMSNRFLKKSPVWGIGKAIALKTPQCYVSYTFWFILDLFFCPWESTSEVRSDC